MNLNDVTLVYTVVNLTKDTTYTIDDSRELSKEDIMNGDEIFIIPPFGKLYLKPYMHREGYIEFHSFFPKQWRNGRWYQLNGNSRLRELL